MTQRGFRFHIYPLSLQTKQEWCVIEFAKRPGLSLELAFGGKVHLPMSNLS